MRRDGAEARICRDSGVRAVDVDILCRTALQFVQARAQAKDIQLFRAVTGEVEACVATSGA
jgi:hypothetical protein